MAAYAVFDVVEVTDAAIIEQYRSKVSAVVEKFGGRYLVRGGAVEPKEGECYFSHPVIVEFPSLEQANTWYNSPEYQELAALRHQGSKANGVFIDGV